MGAVAILAVLQVAQGFQKSQDLREQAKQVREQGEIEFEENKVAARQLAISNRQFLTKQQHAYIKNGVTLEGSPMLVLEETFQIGRAEEEALVRRGRARFQLTRAKASQLKRASTAALIGGAIGAASTLQKSGAFDPGTVASEKASSEKAPRKFKGSKGVFFSGAGLGLGPTSDPQERFWSRTSNA